MLLNMTFHSYSSSTKELNLNTKLDKHWIGNKTYINNSVSNGKRLLGHLDMIAQTNHRHMSALKDKTSVVNNTHQKPNDMYLTTWSRTNKYYEPFVSHLLSEGRCTTRICIVYKFLCTSIKTCSNKLKILVTVILYFCLILATINEFIMPGTFRCAANIFRSRKKELVCTIKIVLQIFFSRRLIYIWSWTPELWMPQLLWLLQCPVVGHSILGCYAGRKILCGNPMM